MAIVAAAALWSAAAVHCDEKKSDPDGDATISGQIVPHDVRDRVRKFPCKIHTFRLAKGAVYVIDMTSTNFDAFLRIEDSAGQQLAEDDDSGGNLNARIRFTAPQDATFQIIATSYSGGAGAYTLKVVRARK